MRNGRGNRPLHALRDAMIARMLLDAKADVTAKDERGRTPLHFANNKGVAMVLMDVGASLQEISDEGATPLHTMCRRVHFDNLLDLVGELIVRGADVKAKNQKGIAALQIVVERVSEYWDKNIFRPAISLLILAGAEPFDMSAIKTKELTTLFVAQEFAKRAAAE